MKTPNATNDPNKAVENSSEPSEPSEPSEQSDAYWRGLNLSPTVVKAFEQNDAFNQKFSQWHQKDPQQKKQHLKFFLHNFFKGQLEQDIVLKLCEIIDEDRVDLDWFYQNFMHDFSLTNAPMIGMQLVQIVVASKTPNP